MSLSTLHAVWAASVIATTCFCTTIGFSQDASPQQKRVRMQLSSDDRPDVRKRGMLRTRPKQDSATEIAIATPKLGFHGRMHRGWGMVVTSVEPGSTAQRMGLKTGDVIIRVNADSIKCHRGWQQSVRRAMWERHGRVVLKVDNVRNRYNSNTPRFVSVSGWLDTVPVTLPVSHTNAENTAENSRAM